MTRPWINLLLGAWILISPWILGFNGISIMMWSNVIAGTVLVLLAAWTTFGEKEEES